MDIITYGVWIRPEGGVGGWMHSADGQLFWTTHRGVAEAALQHFRQYSRNIEAWVAMFGPDGSARTAPAASPSEHK